MHETSVAPPSPQPTSQIRVVLAITFLAYLAQMTLSPVIAPLSREVNLAEWQVGLTISAAAVMVVCTSQFWGRRSQSWGSRKVLILAMTILTLAMGCFTIGSALAMGGALGPTLTFIVFLLTRGVFFGGALAAIAPTAQTYITRVTTTEAERVKGMAGVGAVQGIAMIFGAVTGGLLAGIGLLVSIGTVPVVLAIGLVISIVVLNRAEPGGRIPSPPHISPFDHRVGPFLLAGFGMFTALGFIQIIAGFLVQDRYTYDANTTGLMAGLALLASGVAMILAQAIVVPKTGWSPATLLRVGTGIGVVGFVLLYINGPIWLLVLGMSVITFGIAIAMPGYTAGPTLLMNVEEQGGVAGLIGATNGLTFVFAPVVSTALYAVWPQLPVVIGGCILTVVFALVCLHPRFSRLPKTAPGVALAVVEDGEPT